MASDKDYKIDFTDPNSGFIFVPAGGVRGPSATTEGASPRNVQPTDIDLVGMGHSLWGEHILENLLHMLENFASEEDPIAAAGSPPIIQPDPASSNFAAVTPVDGEIWYNKTAKVLYFYREMGSPPVGSWERLGLANALDNYYTKAQVDARVPPTGAVELYAGDGTLLDTNVWAICDGSEYDPAAQPDLYAIIGTTYNTGGETPGWFRVPDMRNLFALGANPSSGIGIPGGEASVTLVPAELPAHTHTGTTDSDGIHTHAGSTTTNGSHTHSGSTSSAGSHTHSGSTSSAGNHRHWTDGGGPAATTEANGDNNKPLWDAAGWTNYAGAHTHGMSLNNAGAHSHSLSLNANGNHNHSFTTGSAGGHTHTFTTSSVGSGAAHNNLPPYLTLNYIIKL